jgi:hypothetical protein
METPVMQCTPAFFFGATATMLVGAPSVTDTSSLRRDAAISAACLDTFFVR